MIHPDDAAARDLVDGGTARVATSKGAIELPVEVTDTMMQGVVSVPHGWGHNRRGTRMRVAEANAGVSVNDIIDPARIDVLSGTSALSGQPVEVTRA
jgi:anaerobic selenocysteine-containing dehydrogenase